MLRLPICPYCGYKFDYAPAKNALKEKQVKCKKCGKLMSVSFKKAAAKTAFLFFVFLVFVNTLYLFNSKSRTIIPNVVLTVVFIFVYLAIVPLKISFGKIDGQEDPPEKLKKNRHRHKKTKNNLPEFNDNPIEGTSFDK